MPGRYFEDFQTGESFTTDSRTLTQEDVAAFAAVSGDHNPLHLDAEYAAGTRFGRPIAHGLLGLSIATGLIGEMGLTRGTLIALTGLEWRFLAPIYPGTTLHCLMKVESLHRSDRGKRGRLVWFVELRDDEGSVLQEGTLSALMRARP